MSSKTRTLEILRILRERTDPSHFITTPELMRELEEKGIVIQVRGSDMDYLDSQLLLQDVAYYPIGRPSAAFKGIHMTGSEEVTVAGILASLIDMASEGED